MKTSKKTRRRIGKAILKGWGIRWFKKCEREGGRHSVWIFRPDSTDCYAEKVSVVVGESNDGWINRLLDEAGVP